MISKISFYAYFFCPQAECIIRYDILFKSKNKFLLKSTTLDSNYKNPTDDVIVMVYPSLTQCITGIVGRLRNIELQFGLYKTIAQTTELTNVYQPLIEDLERYISSEKIYSFSLFGNRSKYKSQSETSKILKSMGYLQLTTRRPHLYVIDDFIREEINLLTKLSK